MLTQYSPRAIDTISADTEVTNTIAPVNAGSSLLRGHLARERLGQEVGTLQVDPQQFLEAVFARVEDVGPHARRTPRVVDESVDGAVALADGCGEAAPVRRTPDISLKVLRHPLELIEHATDRIRFSYPAERQSPAFGRECARDAQADAACAASDQRDAGVRRLK